MQDISHIRQIPGRTAIYNAFHTGQGDLDVAVADMDIFDDFPESAVFIT
jgi:hypothetical protein